VTFSFKYREYLRYVREKQVARAENIIKRGTAGKHGKSQNDPKRFIKSESCTADGELAQYNSYSLNQEMIDQESRFDGFYGICTDMEDDAPVIIRTNGGRWIIEDCFRITKTDFEASSPASSHSSSTNISQKRSTAEADTSQLTRSYRH